MQKPNKIPPRAMQRSPKIPFPKHYQTSIPGSAVQTPSLQSLSSLLPLLCQKSLSRLLHLKKPHIVVEFTERTNFSIDEIVVHLTLTDSFQTHSWSEERMAEIAPGIE